MSVMTAESSNRGSNVPAVADDWESQLNVVLRLAEGLVASPEPSVVFGSLAELSVPMIGDACIIAASGPAVDPFAVIWPPVRPQLTPPATAGAPRTSASVAYLPIVGPVHPSEPERPGPSYEGVFTLIWESEAPSAQHTLLARLLVDRAVDLAVRERLGEERDLARAHAANCELALASNRTIGTALGILMERYKLTNQQSFELLRRVSQHQHRKLRDCADDLVETGEFLFPRGVQPLS